MVFSLHDPHELEGLLAGAGFEDISVRPHRKSLRLRLRRRSSRQYVCSTRLAPAVAGLGQHGRASLERDVVSEWKRLTRDGELVLELDLVVVTARKK